MKTLEELALPVVALAILAGLIAYDVSSETELVHQAAPAPYELHLDREEPMNLGEFIIIGRIVGEALDTSGFNAELDIVDVRVCTPNGCRVIDTIR